MTIADSKMDVILGDTSHVQELQSLLTLYFPQYGEIQYEKIEISQPLNLYDYKEKAKSHPPPTVGVNEKSVHYKCNLCIFGLPIENNTLYIDWEDAREATAKSACVILTEFLRLIHGRVEDENFGELFAPIVGELESYREDADLISAEEQEAINAGHKPIVRINDLGRNTEAKTDVLGPLLGSLLSKVTSTREPSKNANLANTTKKESTNTKIEISSTPVSAPTSILAPSTSTTTLSSQSYAKTAQSGQNPITILYEHYQKTKGEKTKPELEDFQNGIYYGASGTYGGETAVVKAVYRRKNEALQEVARLLCGKILGDIYTFTPIAPAIGNLADVEATDTIIGKSKDILTSKDGLPPIAPLTLVEKVEALQSELPSGPLELDCPSKGQKFVSLVNEFCQITGIPSPSYDVKNANFSASNAYCCCVTFEGRRFTSFAFQKKQDAKEDCAGRIFLYLKEKGLVDKTGRTIRKAQDKFGARRDYNYKSSGTSSYSSHPRSVPFKRSPDQSTEESFRHISPNQPFPDPSMMPYQMAIKGRYHTDPSAHIPTPPPLHTLHPQFGKSGLGDLRDSHDHRSSSHSRDSGDLRGSHDHRSSSRSRDSGDLRGSHDHRSSSRSRDSGDLRGSHDHRSSSRSRDSGDLCGFYDLRDSRSSNNSRDSGDLRDSRDFKDLHSSRGHGSSKSSRDFGD